jgi:serine/threonine-protein kinase
LERTIDRYRLLEEVGSGGMAVVYRALDTVLGREVAVKVMHPHLAGREESRKRFSREARAVAKLRHPNIVEIFDFSGEHAPESFIVTEFVRGRTLRVFGDEIGPRLPEVGALLVDALAAALEHAHAHGVLHRDLKPENVMVSDAGELKLMDFGIARLLEGDEKMTMTGALVGSPLHMAPEVIEGRESDARADVFALGTILYWLVAGRMAFQAKTTTLTLRQILEGAFEDPRLAAPACSDLLAEAIDRCLRRDPAERLESMTALRAALGAVFAEAGIDDPVAERRAFFADPAGYGVSLRSRLVARLAARAEALLAERRTPLALSCFDRVLALDPGNEAVSRQLDRLRRRRARRQRLGRAGMVAAGLAVATLAVAGVGRLLRGDASGPGAGPASGIVANGGPPGGSRGGGVSPGGPGGSAGGVSTGVSAGGVSPGDPAGVGSPAGSTGGVSPDGSDVLVGDVSPGASPADGAPATANGPAGGAGPGATAGGTGADDATPADDAPPAPPRHVTIAWSPPGPGVRLEVDGLSRDTATTPFWEGNLPVGTHAVSVARPDCCEPERQTIVVPAGDGELPPFRIALQPRPAFLVIRSPRDDLAVSVDGEPRGLLRAFPGGRVPVPLASGSQRHYRKEVEVTLASTDGVHFTRTVVLRAGQDSPVEVVLE